AALGQIHQGERDGIYKYVELLANHHALFRTILLLRLRTQSSLE
ncbi:MAG: hypothetical protein ACI8UP_002441, partial [Porticoccaceae bacterium]